MITFIKVKISKLDRQTNMLFIFPKTRAQRGDNDVCGIFLPLTLVAQFVFLKKDAFFSQALYLKQN